MLRGIVSILVVTCGVSAVACSSSETPAPGPEPGGTARTPNEAAPAVGGTTPCGAMTCQAGLYCQNLVCLDGCLADTNCVSNQSCVKEAESNVGACQNRNAPPQTEAGAPDCNAFCAKGESCDPQGWKGLVSSCSQAKGRSCVCSDVCLAVKSDCLACWNTAATCGDAASCRARCR